MERREERQNWNRGPNFRDGVCSFVHDANDKELRDAIEASGENPDALAQRGRAIAERALKRYVAGLEAESLNSSEGLILREAMSALLQLLRRREGLSRDQLAERARVEITEIRMLESDTSFVPSPRTIYQLEQTFRLPQRTLLKLSGMTGHRSGEFAQEVMRFAANAKTMNSLTRAEKKVLSDFVEFLITTKG
jgi:transcriptional regulator with XRE-family HTH domain